MRGQELNAKEITTSSVFSVSWKTKEIILRKEQFSFTKVKKFSSSKRIELYVQKQ